MKVNTWKKLLTFQEVMSFTQRSWLGFIGLAIFIVVIMLSSKKYFSDFKRNDGLLLEMLANVSSGLERLDAELDGISGQTAIARSKLKQLVALHRENLSLCVKVKEKILQRTGRSHTDTTSVQETTESSSGTLHIRR